MEQVHAEINAELDAIEREHGVKAIYAVESGSRAWGFESPDSDYDVRFVYVRPRDDYLRIESVRDVIDWQPEPILDITGWDLPKTLRLMRKSNPSLYEWMASPIIYRTTPLWGCMQPMLDRCFSSRSLAMHYLHMAQNNWKSYFTGESVRLKKYFYVLRPILACQWVLERATMAPIRFAELIDALLDGRLRPVVDDLLARKRLAVESDEIGRVPELDGFIETQLTTLDASVRELPEPELVSWDELDALFIAMLAQKPEE